MNEGNFIGIKELPTYERPRERALENGISALSNYEIIAILFRTGIKGKSAVDLAKSLLKETGSLRCIVSKSPKELSRICNIGVVRAITLLSALELSKRLSFENIKELEKIDGADDAYEFLKPRLRDLPYEAFGIIFLNQKHGILSFNELFRGSVNLSAVHPREVIREVLKENASAVIIAHNHPSGSLKPSNEDIALTQKIETLLNYLEVRLLDHIIIGGNSFFSFAREGLLPTNRQNF